MDYVTGNLLEAYMACHHMRIYDIRETRILGYPSNLENPSFRKSSGFSIPYIAATRERSHGSQHGTLNPYILKLKVSI